MSLRRAMPTAGRDTELAQMVTDEADNRTVNSYDALYRLTEALTSGGPSRLAFTSPSTATATAGRTNLQRSITIVMET